MSSTTITPSLLEALKVWVGFGEARLGDTAWSRVDLDDKSSWPTDEQVIAGEFYFDRWEIESLLEAQAWLAAQSLENSK